MIQIEGEAPTGAAAEALPRRSSIPVHVLGGDGVQLSQNVLTCVFKVFFHGKPGFYRICVANGGNQAQMRMNGQWLKAVGIYKSQRRAATQPQ